MSITAQPHIYKKNVIVKLKPLGINSAGKRYVFNSSNANIRLLVDHCNNLNEIVGRIILGVWKLNSFFGLSKDPSEEYSKNPSVYNTAKTLLGGGSSTENTNKNDLKDIKKLLEQQNSRIKNLEEAIKAVDAKIEPEPLTKQEVKELKESIAAIRNGLKNIVGE